MLSKIKNIFSFFYSHDYKKIENFYLSESESLEQLEFRQRQIQKGMAPWQVRANLNLQGWV